MKCEYVITLSRNFAKCICTLITTVLKLRENASMSGGFLVNVIYFIIKVFFFLNFPYSSLHAVLHL